MAFPARAIRPTLTEIAELEALTRSRASSVGLRRRARVILLIRSGLSGTATADRSGYTAVQVSRIRSRFAHGGVTALRERPRPGRPRMTDKLARVAALTLPPPGSLGPRTSRDVGKASGVSDRTVRRVWDERPELRQGSRTGGGEALKKKVIAELLREDLRKLRRSPSAAATKAGLAWSNVLGWARGRWLPRSSNLGVFLRANGIDPTPYAAFFAPLRMVSRIVVVCPVHHRSQKVVPSAFARIKKSAERAGRLLTLGPDGSYEAPCKTCVDVEKMKALACRRGGLQRMIDRADGYSKLLLEQIAEKRYESLRAAAKVARLEPHTLGRWCGTELARATARPMAKAFWPSLDRLGIRRELFKGWVLPMKAVCHHCGRLLSDASWYYQKRTRQSPETFAHRGCLKKARQGYIPSRCIGAGCKTVTWYTPSAYGNLKWTATIGGECVHFCGRCAGKKRMESLHRRFRRGIPVEQLAARRGRVA